VNEEILGAGGSKKLGVIISSSRGDRVIKLALSPFLLPMIPESL